MSLPANISTQLAGLKDTSTRMQTEDTDGAQYLKMDKGGHWIYGADEIDVEERSVWAINPISLTTGFIAWGDGELLAEEMRPASEAPVTRAELEDVGAAWKPQVGFQMACTDGEDQGVQVIFKSSSKGGQKAFKGILDAIIKKADEGTADVVPLVELDNDSYKHKEYGKIYTPVFKIVGWSSADGLGAAEEVEAETEEAKQDAPAEEEKPRSRRRSRKK